MPITNLSDGDFIRLFEERGATGASDATGLKLRTIYGRRLRIEARIGRRLVAPMHSLVRNMPERLALEQHPGRLISEVENGFVLVGSDCHYWPGPASLMHKAFVLMCKELKPKEVILNGDVIDACQISRHPPIGWTHQPTVQEEIEAAQERLHEIEQAAGRAKKHWPVGNHDSRFATRLASVAPEFAKVKGTRLADHFPLWSPCWSVWVNDEVMIKHRGRGGIHATRNNVMNFRMHCVTSHLHSAKVAPITDIKRITLYGVDTGCIADPSHRAFLDYTEDGVSDWRDAFCVLTFKNKRLMAPELVTRWDENSVQWRGEVVRV